MKIAHSATLVISNKRIKYIVVKRAIRGLEVSIQVWLLPVHVCSVKNIKNEFYETHTYLIFMKVIIFYYNSNVKCKINNILIFHYRTEQNIRYILFKDVQLLFIYNNIYIITEQNSAFIMDYMYGKLK